MPRLPRFVLPGQPLHLIQRGNNRAPLFLSVEEFRYYRHVLHDASVRTACAIHAYVLMTNHVHLLVTPTHTNSAARLMQTIGRTYVRWFNARHRRSGTLWEGRYRSSLIDSDAYLLTCSRYLELNPIRAGMVARPEDYAWSSFRRNAHSSRFGSRRIGIFNDSELLNPSFSALRIAFRTVDVLESSMTLTT